MKEAERHTKRRGRVRQKDGEMERKRQRNSARRSFGGGGREQAGERETVRHIQTETSDIH